MQFRLIKDYYIIIWELLKIQITLKVIRNILCNSFKLVFYQLYLKMYDKFSFVPRELLREWEITLFEYKRDSAVSRKISYREAKYLRWHHRHSSAFRSVPRLCAFSRPLFFPVPSSIPRRLSYATATIDTWNICEIHFGGKGNIS